jgi:hypothetical protein
MCGMLDDSLPSAKPAAVALENHPFAAHFRSVVRIAVRFTAPELPSPGSLVLPALHP